MHVVIDLTALLPEPTGVDTYLRQLVLHLGLIDHDNHYTILVNYEDRRLFDGVLPRNFAIVPLCFRPRPIRLLLQQVVLPAVARWCGVDVVHSPSFIMPFYRGRPRHVLTVYDMTSFSLPHCHTPLHRSGIYRRAVLASIRRADLVTVPSRFTQQAILNLVPELPPGRVCTIAPGIGEEFRVCHSQQIREVLDRHRLPDSYILYVGTIEPRKNLERLVEGYRRLIATGTISEHLVFAGRSGWGHNRLLAQLNSSDLRGRVHLTGYVTQSDLLCLYAGATLFVYPSLEEGFGFPPLEAMACGVPTISSLSSALAENLEGAAELVPPDDVEALTDAMRRLLQDASLRAKCREQGLERAAQFRWKETARQTLSCYSRLASGELARRRP